MEEHNKTKTSKFSTSQFKLKIKFALDERDKNNFFR
jgi:hypothetical protein